VTCLVGGMVMASIIKPTTLYIRLVSSGTPTIGSVGKSVLSFMLGAEVSSSVKEMAKARDKSNINFAFASKEGETLCTDSNSMGSFKETDTKFSDTVERKEGYFLVKRK